jgi:hypothetical protein
MIMNRLLPKGTAVSAEDTSFVHDTRGSMLVIGIPLGLLLTGIVWHLVGACDTILLSQLLRFSADQTAFETAIWHARGMNVIAIINLAMQSLSTIWLAWHILAGTIPVAAIPCDTTPAVCDGKSTQDGYDLASRMDNAEPAVETWVSDQMQALTKLEVITSAVTPVIALVTPANRAESRRSWRLRDRAWRPRSLLVGDTPLIGVASRVR